ncbi:MAG: hypothetical protein ACI8XO_005021 [Verrucomicrobiales bacterium]|jgi:hypothetical protein
MIKKKAIANTLFATLIAGSTAIAQQLPGGGGAPAAGGGNTTIVNEEQNPQPKPFLGTDVPVFDPGTDNFTWDGKSWNINNNRLVRMRFEKYLSTREADSTEDGEYRAILKQVMDALSPHNRKLSKDSPLQQAVALLPKASRYKIDAHLCDSISQAIYTVWLAQKNVRNLATANTALDEETKKLHWNAEVAGSEDKADSGAGGKGGPGGTPAPNAQKTAVKISRVTGYIQRLAEIQAIKATNKGKMGISETQSKIEYQALIMQLAVQRRFEHVVIATELYNRLFGDGDNSLTLEEGSDADKMLGKGLGFNPTITTLNAFAREAIRDVDEGVEAFEDLVARDELKSATEQLMQAFFVGEYLPKIRTLEREKKRRVLGFTRDLNLLISAMDFRDYAEGASIVERMRKDAKDFDYSAAKAKITVYTTASDAYVMSAKIAAQQGDMDKFQKEMANAAQAWPGNPKIKEAGKQFSVLADRQIQTLNDLDRLLSQKDYHGVAADFGRFAAAVADDEQKTAQLKKVMEDVSTIKYTIQAAEEISNAGNPWGAWERIQTLTEQFPRDPEVNKLAMQLTTKVGEFVSTLQKAEQLEENNQVGSSLAWYLKARRTYPASSVAETGINRLLDKILPKDDDGFGMSAPNNSASDGDDLEL